MWKLLSLFLLSASLFSSPLHDRLKTANPGDYLVVEGGKMITIISIRSVNPNTIVFEEVSAPSENLKKRPASWSDWIKSKAPGHSSWSMIELQKTNGEVIECYSFTKGAWVQLSTQKSLIATLLTLDLKRVPKETRRKIGPPPQPGEMDTRKIWEPAAIVEGKKQDKMRMDVFETTWPKDQSQLSGNKVLLYFDAKGKFPFPFWIQMETTLANFALRTIDTGKNFPSPYRRFPRRVPEFVGEPKRTSRGLKLFLKSPKYFREFDLFVIDVTEKDKELCPVQFTVIEAKDERLTIEIDTEELNQVLKGDHKYTWLLVPVGNSDSYTETTKPFIWN